MGQFWTILGFELKQFFKNKVFVGITLFLIIAIAVLMNFPRIAAIFDGGADEAGATDGDRAIMLVSSEDREVPNDALQMFATAFSDYEVQATADSLDDIRRQVTDGDVAFAVVLTGVMSYTYYVNGVSLYDENVYRVDETMLGLYRMRAMTENGISASQAEEILSQEITHEVHNLGKDQTQTFFYTYVMIFALYMVILMYGQMVAMNVASEKSSRAMEVLITSAKPNALIFGKVIASCIAGLVQLVCVFGSAILFFRLNKSYWSDNQIILSMFNIPVSVLVYMIVFFLLGFFLYAFMYGAVGSTASKVEDLNTSIMPITMLFIVAFFAVIFSMSSGNVDNMTLKVCSYIPFTSPMAMFTRITMSTVPMYEVIISIVILVVSVIAVGILSAKIYRAGVLLYGNALKFKSILKLLKRA